MGDLTDDYLRESETAGAAALLRRITRSRPAPTVKHCTPPPRSRLLWAAVDVDGTLAQPLWTPQHPTSAIGEPIWENVAKVRALAAAGYKIVGHTSRPDTDYEALEMWFNHYGIPCKTIRTGKPLAAVYIDDRAVHADEPDWLERLKEINGG